MPDENEASIFNSFFGHLKKLVYKEFSWHHDIDNLIGVGSESLLRAIRSFDPGRGVPFWGYAKVVVRRDINKQVTREDKMEHYIDDFIITSRNARL